MGVSTSEESPQLIMWKLRHVCGWLAGRSLKIGGLELGKSVRNLGPFSLFPWEFKNPQTQVYILTVGGGGWGTIQLSSSWVTAP